MKIKYFKEADILLTELRDGTPVDSIDVKEELIIHSFANRTSHLYSNFQEGFRFIGRRFQFGTIIMLQKEIWGINTLKMVFCQKKDCI